MYRIESKLDTVSEEFRTNVKVYQEILKNYFDTLNTIKIGRAPESVKRHKERGKLLARERVDLLIDRNSPFIELSPFAAFGLHNNTFPSAGIITGIGVINGREAVIIANDATVKGGTYIKETIKKHLRAQQIALENNLPCVYMVDSGGIFLPEQSNVFPDRNDFGRFFYNQSKMSAAGIAQIAIVMGSCTAGGAYIPAMCDETIIVKNQGTIFIGGPPLVKAATGEEVTAEELGGADVHSRISGVADHLAENDHHALDICRNIFKTLSTVKKQSIERVAPEAPFYDQKEIYGIIQANNRKPVDVKEIIARLVDGSRFHEFKAEYAPTLVTGFAYLNGYMVGIVANNGVIFSESALKGAHFIELCCSRKIPLIFLQNITGFIVGKKYEHGGIARDGAKLINAVAAAAVPKFTIIFGGSYGAGNYAMAGRAFDPRLLFMWPNAKISVMGSEQASNVLLSVKKEQYRISGKEMSPDEEKNIKDSISKSFEDESSAYYSSSRLWDDGIIDPLDTRTVITAGISASLNSMWEDTQYGIFRM